MITRRDFSLGLSVLTVPAVGFGNVPAGHGRPAPPWPNGRRGAVSLTYDDGLDSHLDHVGPALDAMGLKATFFLTLENMASRAANWQALASRGHEIGDHSFHHVCHLEAYSAARFEKEEIAPTEQFLDLDFGTNRHRTFAYPCGAIELGAGGQLEGELRYISVLRRYFMAARAADGDPNDPAHVGRERYQLRATAPTYDRDDPQLAINYLRSALARSHWAILIFHDVLPTRSQEGETSIASHAAVLEWISHHPLWCAPMRDVFAHLVHAR